MEVVIYIIIGVLGTVIGYLINKSKSSSMETTISIQKTTIDELKNELESNKRQSNQEKELINEKNLVLEKQVTQLDGEKKSLEEKLSTQKQEIEEINTKFKVEFENLSTKILEQSSKKLEESNLSNLSIILNPFKTKLDDFKEIVEKANKDDLVNTTTLQAELKNLLELNKIMSEETNNLTKALKGESKTQGGWGEMILDKVLEKSGLIEGEQYERQKNISDDEGNRLQPDVILNLPNERFLVIDSKVSLTAYTNYCNATDETDVSKYLKEHITSVKNHIKGLSSKEYEKLHQSRSLDFVLMFMPIEAAFVVAMKESPEIFNDAFSKGIVIVSPTTLLATAKTIESIWKQEHRSKNAEDIAKRGAILYDKFVGFLGTLEDIGRHIERTQSSYDDAIKKLQSGSGNLIRQTEMLKELGITSKKPLPEKFKIEEIDESEGNG